jgi:hypothetical protein
VVRSSVSSRLQRNMASTVSPMFRSMVVLDTWARDVKGRPSGREEVAEGARPPVGGVLGEGLEPGVDGAGHHDVQPAEARLQLPQLPQLRSIVDICKVGQVVGRK